MRGKRIQVSGKQKKIINSMFSDCWWINRYIRMSIIENRLAGNHCYKRK